MLGDKLGDFTGKVTGSRMLPGDDYRYLKQEVSFEQQGTLLGMQAQDMGTFTVFERVPGQLYGQGQGMIMTADGQGAIWNGHGIGRMTGQGMAYTFAFAIALQAPTEGPLARLNGVLVVGEHAADAEGNTKTSLSEWKT